MNESTAHVMIMNSFFDFVYAKALYECLGHVVKQNCYGCEVNHPSQVQHSCIMYDKQEHIEIDVHSERGRDSAVLERDSRYP